MQRLSIGIDGYNLAMPNGTGVTTYGLALAETLRNAGHRIQGVFGLDPGNDSHLFEVQFFDRFANGEPPRPNTRRQRRRDRWARLWEGAHMFRTARATDVPLTHRVEKSAFAGRLPQFDRLVTTPGLFDIAHRHFARTGRFVTVSMERPPAIMHWTYPVPVTLRGARNIYTMHDLVPLRLPYTTLDRKACYDRLVRACARTAAHICTVSDASRHDIIDQLGVPETHVTNTYQASPMPDQGDAAADAAIVKGVFGLDHRSYFLFFGAIEPKKNIGRLLEAFLGAQLSSPLVLVGARAWQSEGELALLPQEAAEGGAERIVRLDYLPRNLLLKLIRSARAVLFPSLCEGFGLPLLEAMQLGTPVLTSTTSSLPEIAGSAALLVDPYDVSAIAAGLRALDTDDALRDRLAADGPARAALFSRARYRERLEELYARVLAEGR